MFSRTLQLLGDATFQRMQTVRVILFGVGGVGGWCAEALVRTGIQHLTLVDMDIVNESNLNRQIVATTTNIGLSKVDEMKKRLLSIQPQANICALHAKYDPEGCLDFGDHKEKIDFSAYDFVVDAIDTLDCKVRLIYEVTRLNQASTGNAPILFSAMGAGRKVDTQQIRVSEFRKVEGCPLARALRTKMKKTGLLPATKFQCVWSPELAADSGTIAPVVGTFGMQLASLVVRACQTNQ